MSDGASSWSEVTVGDAAIAVSTTAPVAVIRRAGAAEVLATWPDLDAGTRGLSCTVLGAPTGAWAFYRPQESEAPGSPAHASAVHVDADARVTRFSGLAEHQALGVTRHGLWLTADMFPDPDDPGVWRIDRDVRVLGSDGSVRGIRVDRLVAFALDDGRAAQVVLYRGAPDAERSNGGASYTYRYLTAPLGDELLAVIRADELDSAPFDEAALLETMAAVTPRIPDTSPADPGVRWNQVSLSTPEESAAVAAVVDEFAHLAAFWRHDDGSTEPLSRGLGDPRVDVIGPWPDTRVEVSFTHPHFSAGRLRRTLRVFDDAGRVIPPLYASVHLMEDLDTGALPDPSTARGGILDI
jgi:hypothetical protein